MRDTCPVCMGGTSAFLFKRDFSGMRSIVPFSRYNIVKCRTCGMIYAGDIAEALPLSEYYSLFSKYETKAYFETAYTREDSKDLIFFLKDYINIGDAMLDMGCGTGSLLYSFKLQGYRDLTGVDPSERNVNFIKSSLGISAHVGSLGDGYLDLGKKFKLITLEGVLEHISCLDEAMNELCKYLLPDGYIFLEVPDICAWRNINDLYQQFSVEHLNYFTKQSLDIFMRRFGFSCVKYQLRENIFGSWSLWKKSKYCDTAKFSVDGDEALDMYLNNANALAETLKERLRLYKNRDVYIWGAGTHTAMLYQLNLLHDINVIAIVDSNEKYHGKNIFGVEVIAPQKLGELEELPIIISSQLAQESIRKQISGNYTNEIVTLY